jgi:dihydropyrimidinase
VVQAEPGTAQYLPRGPYDMVKPRGVLANGFDAAPPL